MTQEKLPKKPANDNAGDSMPDHAPPDGFDPRDLGLRYDLLTLSKRLIDRRRVLGWAAAGGLAVMVPLACGGGSENNDSGGSGGSADDDSGADDDTGASDDDTADDDAADDDTGGESCSQIPEETAGPFPGDGTNGANALEESGIVRSDVRSTTDGATTAPGVEFTLTIKLVNAAGACAPLAGYAVYIWHCDAPGRYSMYDLPDVDYLRGVQAADAEGRLTFTTIVPGCYVGRWPHIHFEVFPSLAAADNGANKVATSQFALPSGMCAATYETADYAASATNFAGVSLETDGVFADGHDLQLLTATGSVAAGFTSEITVGIDV